MGYIAIYYFIAILLATLSFSTSDSWAAKLGGPEAGGSLPSVRSMHDDNAGFAAAIIIYRARILRVLRWLSSTLPSDFCVTVLGSLVCCRTMLQLFTWISVLHYFIWSH
jgi:hypothetical protein